MKAVIVKLSSLGDIVQALPCAAYLKERGYHVTWVVDLQFSSLVAACPFVDKVIDVPIRFWKSQAPRCKELYDQYKRLRLEKYDLMFDLQGNIKSGLASSAINARFKIGFGKQGISEWLALFACHFHFDPPANLNIREDYLHVLQAYFEDRTSYHAPLIKLISEETVKPVFTSDALKITVAAGSQWSNKELKWETLLALIQKLDRAFSIEWLFTSGSEREKGYADTLAQSVKLARRLHLPPIPYFQQVMLEGDALLALDSLPLHLAGLAGIPAFSFFGPSLAAKFAPQKGAAFQGSCPYGETFPKRCSKLRSCPTSACIKDLDVGALFASVQTFLSTILSCPRTPYEK
jgi:heptosyltransferase-1